MLVGGSGFRISSDSSAARHTLSTITLRTEVGMQFWRSRVCVCVCVCVIDSAQQRQLTRARRVNGGIMNTAGNMTTNLVLL